MDVRPYFYRLRGRSLGPIGLQQMRQLAQRAQVGRGTDVSRDGIQWAKASDFPEIFVLGSVTPPDPTEGINLGGSSGGGGAGGEVILPASGPRWYYTVHGTQQGPVDLSTLQQLVASGMVSAGDHAIPEGGSQWMVVSSVPQLAGMISRGGGMPSINTGGGQPGPSNRQSTQTEGTNGMAIAGFVVSLLGCGFVGLILSLVALNSRNRANRGLAIAGAIIGGIVTLLQLAWIVLVVVATVANG
jgi:hypothetical protein